MSLTPRIAYERRRVGTARRLVPVILVGAVASVAVSSVMAGLVVSMSDVVSVSEFEALVFVLSRGSMMPLIAGLAAAILVGSEYRHRTIEVTLMLTPRRSLVVAAYLTWQGILAIVLGLVGTTIAAIATAVTGHLPEPAFVAGAVGVHVITCVVWSVWATALVLIFRSRGLTVFVMSVWALVVEPAIGGATRVLGGAARTAAHYLPFDLLDALTTALAPRGSVLLATSGRLPLFDIVFGLTLITGVLVVAALVRLSRQRRV